MCMAVFFKGLEKQQQIIVHMWAIFFKACIEATQQLANINLWLFKPMSAIVVFGSHCHFVFHLRLGLQDRAKQCQNSVAKSSIVICLEVKGRV